jgi:putative peptidoglycan lipid II flippase
VQVNVLINSGFAARLGDGPVSWLNIAFRLMQLPLGIFGVAVGTVTLPLVSRNAAIGNISGFCSALAHAMRLVMLLTIPAAVGLIVLARPIISVIYEHGRFDASATEQTAAALQFYAIGLAGYSAVKVLAPAFYAIDRRYLPMLVSFFSIGVNFALNWFFMFKVQMGHRGLALSTSLVAVTNFLLLYIMMRRYAGPIETGQMLKLFGKLLPGVALLALICWAALRIFFAPGVRVPEWQKIFEVAITIGVAAAAFFGAAYLLRVAELRDIVDLVRRKLARSNQPSA